jgi:hypothetical protein
VTAAQQGAARGPRDRERPRVSAERCLAGQNEFGQDEHAEMLSIDLQGPRLHIRRAQPWDAAASYRWFANPTVTAYLPLAGKGRLPLEEIEAYLTRVATTDRPHLAVGIDRVGDGRPLSSAREGENEPTGRF